MAALNSHATFSVSNIKPSPVLLPPEKRRGVATFDHTSSLQCRPRLNAVGLPRRDAV
jgi:hypothetical protein